jgi:GH24 family phage-related lysozyme (muramidase)
MGKVYGRVEAGAVDRRLMITETLKEQIKIDEGVIYEIYKDHLGYPTFGVGHLVLRTDREFHQADGTAVSQERVDECLANDLQTSFDECLVLYPWFPDAPQEVREILINMMFNLGRPRLSKFKNFAKAMEEQNWKQAAIEGRDSQWYRQVTNRAERLMTRMEAV